MTDETERPERPEYSFDAHMTRRQHLVEGFVGDSPRNRMLYLSSPHFRRAVDTLVSMAPAWIEGMAVAAEQQDRADAQQVRLMQQWPTRPPAPGPLVVQWVSEDGSHVDTDEEGNPR